jgi:hypothetical protein
MELIDTHITFTWEELREAVQEGKIERMLKNVQILLDDGYTFSVHTRYAGDTDFSDIASLRAYIASLS